MQMVANEQIMYNGVPAKWYGSDKNNTLTLFLRRERIVMLHESRFPLRSAWAIMFVDSC